MIEFIPFFLQTFIFYSEKVNFMSNLAKKTLYVNPNIQFLSNMQIIEYDVWYSLTRFVGLYFFTDFCINICYNQYIMSDTGGKL